ncbi:snare associated Golgi protein-domain-containing protein [Syncephalis plumigaleata]|nr:snare associated Golgi protein-domain-containing protein [Syncephalis plumigaleata]
MAQANLNSGSTDQLLLKDKAALTKTSSLLQTTECTDNSDDNKRETQRIGGIGAVVESSSSPSSYLSSSPSSAVQVMDTETVLSSNYNALHTEDNVNSVPAMSHLSNTLLTERNHAVNEKQDTTSSSDIHEHVEAEETDRIQSTSPPSPPPPPHPLSSRVSVTVIDGVTITERPVTWRQRLRTLLPIIVMLVVYGIILALFLIFQSRIFPILQKWSVWLKEAKVGIASIYHGIPPIPGYSISGVFCGYVYGIWIGFIPLIIGSYLGGLVSFVVLRRYLASYAQKMFEENPKVSLVVRAVEGKGIKLLWIMRVAPYPYNLMNALCAASSIPFKNFAIATLLATPKLFLETSIGSGVQSISEGFDGSMTWEKILQLALTLTLGVGVTLYVAWLARRAIKRYKQEQARQNEAIINPSTTNEIDAKVVHLP